jgi:hypothetical protein
MPKLVSTTQTWTALVEREPGDDWPEGKWDGSVHVVLRPERIEIEYVRYPDRHEWVFAFLTVRGQRYRPLKNGTESYHGPGSWRFPRGRFPEEYRGEILDQRAIAAEMYLS